MSFTAVASAVTPWLLMSRQEQSAAAAEACLEFADSGVMNDAVSGTEVACRPAGKLGVGTVPSQSTICEHSARGRRCGES